MLELLKITKDYPAGDGVVHALRGIDLCFRRSEFVSILGPSGCGKTTLLNIVGGLDGYTDGDLVINGTSTKEYTARDWDSYRNHSVGFVFQSYNLIPHQTVLSNVELALTLSGVSKSVRREKARAALEAVGLGDQLSKKPSEMSGGQMQRVAIARALVNDPDIILADEPTGALDTETSVQVMDILKEVSRNRLVVMVTHNPELAEKYSSRIIRMVDGRITADSMPLSSEEYEAECNRIASEKEEKERELIALAEKTGKRVRRKKEKKPSMSFGTSFMLSLRNLFTKKGRTVLTSFAGSIGIIGIALILAVSEGTTAYINHVQENTLASYPITLQKQTVDISSLLESFMSVDSDESGHPNDAVYKDPVIGELVNALSKMETNVNDLSAFKIYLEEELKKDDSKLKDALSGIRYGYDLDLAVYTKNQDGDIIKSDVNELMTQMIADYMIAVGAGMNSSGSQGNSSSGNSGGASAPPMASMMMGGTRLWQELLPGLEEGDTVNGIIEEQYELVHGTWPENKDEIVLILNEKNELNDLTLYALGLLSEKDIDAIIDAAAKGEELPKDNRHWSYEDICKMTFRTIFPYDCYTKVGDIWVDMSENESMIQMLYGNAMELKVVGIIRPDPDSESHMLSGSIGYTHKLTDHIILSAADSAVVKAQLENPTVDILTGLPFKSSTGVLSNEEKAASFREYAAGLTVEEKAKLYVNMLCIEAERAPSEVPGKTQLAFLVDNMLALQNDKEALVNMITAGFAQQMGGGEDTIKAYLSELSLDELKQMLRPAMEEGAKKQIAFGVESSLNVGGLTTDELRAAALDASLSTYTEEQCALYYDELTVFSANTYEENLVKIGALDLDSPSSINLYASTFENKDVIGKIIASYNATVAEEKKISYTDYLGIMMSSITTIIDAITYVLIAFVAISLVVSSIMIGVITLISVQERTKEIGILRAIGASKRDVSSLFNAETVIVGLASGLIGVIVTYILCIPINLILRYFTGIAALNAFLPIGAAAILVGISVLLTLFAGIIPSRSAAKKDPVVALRTE